MAKLRRYRILNDISTKTAAKELHVSTTTISRYETGEHFPPPDVLLRIKDWSGGNVTANDFLDRRLERRDKVKAKK